MDFGGKYAGGFVCKDYSVFGKNATPHLLNIKMYTQEEKVKVYEMKDAGATWKLIGLALNKNPVTVRSWYQRNKINRQLPPKVQVSFL